jgi:hypothetical protein
MPLLVSPLIGELETQQGVIWTNRDIRPVRCFDRGRRESTWVEYMRTSKIPGTGTDTTSRTTYLRLVNIFSLNPLSTMTILVRFFACLLLLPFYASFVLKPELAYWEKVDALHRSTKEENYSTHTVFSSPVNFS